MIKSNRTLIVVAFSALGLAGWKGQDPVEPGDAPPAAQASDETTAPAAAPASAPATPPVKFVLLTDGRLIQGVVTEDPEEDKVIITQPVGAMPFPGKKVERIFATMQEVHAYKRDQVPEDDMDEQEKLAKWCLANGLSAEAQEHLELILKLDPKHIRATAMKTSIAMADARLARRREMDAGVQQAGAEVVDPRPAALDMAVVRGARRGMGISDLPTIFDLPPNAALKRAQEFNNYVHPVLQAYCAKCHDERYDGAFQLVRLRNKSDQSLEALRANLDATLRLVDRDNPGHSELLASSLRPHGSGPNTRPIFPGSNDRAYQILAAWVSNLRSRPAPNPLSGEPARTNSDGDETFAADRSRISRSTAELSPAIGPEGGTFAPPPTRRHIEVPPMRYVPGQGMVEDESDGADAPIPFAVSGVMPKLPAEGAQAAPTIPRPRTRAAAAPPPRPTRKSTRRS
ncbi:hypothetical protein [Planctomyces sp. SH-PL62]|uniref:hypothetical protein n=1 Tax=Planctomyces sp. SH-PL62 TaxID=1636152 RepID=UPI00078BD059|nr:hypothetical protein [Planctomyces sp. SH-PL62]AMV36168.1 hypothetical protein VT85_01900 [Planctomyces sp. SH-PL62]